MQRELRARRWLWLDAVYCGAAGFLGIVLAVPLGRLFHVPAAIVAAIGVATVAWACVLTVLARRREWRRPLGLVGAANVVAAAAVAVLAAVSPVLAARLLLVAVAVEVAAFAAAQLRLLR